METTLKLIDSNYSLDRLYPCPPPFFIMIVHRISAVSLVALKSENLSIAGTGSYYIRCRVHSPLYCTVTSLHYSQCKSLHSKIRRIWKSVFTDLLLLTAAYWTCRFFKRDKVFVNLSLCQFMYLNLVTLLLWRIFFLISHQIEFYIFYCTVCAHCSVDEKNPQLNKGCRSFFPQQVFTKLQV
jgi:hypothetical protein